MRRIPMIESVDGPCGGQFPRTCTGGSVADRGAFAAHPSSTDRSGGARLRIGTRRSLLRARDVRRASHPPGSNRLTIPRPALLATVAHVRPASCRPDHRRLIRSSALPPWRCADPMEVLSKKFRCTHHIPRPPGWPAGFGAVEAAVRRKRWGRYRGERELRLTSTSPAAVSLMTSSRVVIPLRTFSIPSARSVSIPSDTACACSCGGGGALQDHAAQRGTHRHHLVQPLPAAVPRAAALVAPLPR